MIKNLSCDFDPEAIWDRSQEGEGSFSDGDSHLQCHKILDGHLEGQEQLLPESEPNVARMPNEPAKAGSLAGQSGKLVRTSDS